MLGLLHAGPVEFRTGWFVESLATQTLIIFAIRTRKVPFFRSRPSGVLTLTTLVVVGVGIVLTVSPWARSLGFTTLPWQFYIALAVMTVAYLLLVEVTKKFFYAAGARPDNAPKRTRAREHRIHRRAARFSHAGRIAHASASALSP
jgi:Mg2+-importing ATPase